MSPVLKIDRHDEAKEIMFELKYQLSLTTRQRFEMMLKKSKEVRELHIHPYVKGVNFDEVWKNKVKAKFGDTFVHFASLDDLIKMKKASGRSKDLEDLRILRNIKRMKKEGRKKK